MDDTEMTFWIAIWAMILATVIVLSGMFYFSGREEDKMFERLVLKGKDPIELVCAQEARADDPSQPCIQYLARKK